MNIIICGASGYIGSRLYQHLSSFLGPGDLLFGYNRTGLYCEDNPSLSRYEILKAFSSDSDNILVYCVSTQVPGLMAFLSPDSIYKEYSTLQAILADICKSVSLSFVFLISSVGAFAYQNQVNSPLTISEKTQHEISSAYSLSTKLKEDLLSTISSSYSIPICILRLSNVFGPPFLPNRPQGLINKLILSASKCDPVTINIPLSSRKNPLFIEDLCSALANLIDLYLARIHIPNLLIIASSDNLSVGEIIETVNSSLDRLLKPKPIIRLSLSGSDHIQHNSPEFDNSLLLETLEDFSFTPFSVSLENSIRSCFGQLLPHK